MDTAYIIKHVTDIGNPSDRCESTITVTLSLDRARKFVEKDLIPQLKEAVKKEWEGSSEETIQDYMPNFVEDRDIPNRYYSSNTDELIVIEEFDILN